MVQLAGGKLALAQVCAVDYSEAVLLNERVAPPSAVKDYLTRYSGLRQGDLDDAPTFESVQAKVKTLLDGRVLVGHSVSNDLKYLRLKHPAALTVDTAALDWGGREVGLANLAREVLGVDIQGATHCPEEDALTSLRLLKYHVAHGGPPPLRTVDVALEFAAAVPRAAVSKLRGYRRRAGGASRRRRRGREQRSMDAARAVVARVARLVAQVVEEGGRRARRRSSSRRRSRSRSAAPSTATRRISSCPPSRAASTTTATSASSRAPRPPPPRPPPPRRRRASSSSARWSTAAGATSSCARRARRA